MEDPDFLLALKLQQEYNKELIDVAATDSELDAMPVKFRAEKQAPKRLKYDEGDLNCTQNLVHPEWETLDPTPDVHAMFSAFDDKFFQGRLKCVLLEWSKKMYSCAGICYSKRNALGMSITIRLSEPLLKLRPRKNLIETLLHEMIHAYCFVLGIREGNGGHGPNFKKIMNGINKVAGTNITVYHTFHDEVDLYKVHWWRCNGICEHRKPFYGYVKRTSNRPPGPNDFWWKAHVESCGGTFLKIKGPDPLNKKGTKGKEKNQKGKDFERKITTEKDIRNFFGKNSEPKTFNSTNVNKGGEIIPATFNRPNNVIKGPIKSNGGGTLLLNPKTKTTNFMSDSQTVVPSKPTIQGGNLTNVRGLRDLGDDNTKKNQTTKSTNNAFPISSKGYSLYDSSSSKVCETVDLTGAVDRNKLREIWSKRFSQVQDSKMSSMMPKDSDSLDCDSNKSNEKRRRGSGDWEVLSDDVCVRNEVPEIINLSDEEESEDEKKPKIPLTQKERQVQIKKEILDSSGFSEDDIELIDDDYDDTLRNTVDLTDTSLIDDFFGDDALLKDFKLENSLVPCGSRSLPDSNKDIVTCPICQSKITRERLEDHLDGCIGISIKIEPKSYGGKITQGSRIIKPSAKGKPIINSHQKTVLRKAGYSKKEIENLKITPIDTSIHDDNTIDNENLTFGQRRRKGLTSSTHPCPFCGNEVEVEKIDFHLKTCKKSSPQRNLPAPKLQSTPKSSKDIPIQACPVCNKNIKINVMNEHLDMCLEEFNDDF